MQTVIIEKNGDLLVNGVPLSHKQLLQLKRYFIKQEANGYIAKLISVETEGTPEEKLTLFNTICKNETLMDRVADEFEEWLYVSEQMDPVIEHIFNKAIYEVIDFDREMRGLKGK